MFPLRLAHHSEVLLCRHDLLTLEHVGPPSCHNSHCCLTRCHSRRTRKQGHHPAVSQSSAAGWRAGTGGLTQLRKYSWVLACENQQVKLSENYLYSSSNKGGFSRQRTEGIMQIKTRDTNKGGTNAFQIVTLSLCACVCVLSVCV